MTRRIGIYPGTFDPITLGHMDIIERGAKLVDRLIVGVTTNIAKSPMFADEERIAMVEREVFDASLLTARSVLQSLGWAEDEAECAREQFRAANVRLTNDTHPHYKDRAKMIAVSKAGRRQFQAQMARERAERQARDSAKT